MLIKMTSHHLHVFCITPPHPLISSLCFHLHAEPPGMCSSMTAVTTNMRKISMLSPFKPPLKNPPSHLLRLCHQTSQTLCRNRWWKRKPYLLSCPVSALIVLHVMWGATMDLSPLSGSPAPPSTGRRNPQAGAGEESRLTVTSAAVTLASCPHVFSQTAVRPRATEHIQPQRPWPNTAFLTDNLHDPISEKTEVPGIRRVISSNDLLFVLQCQSAAPERLREMSSSHTQGSEAPRVHQLISVTSHTHPHWLCQFILYDFFFSWAVWMEEKE